MDVRHPYVEGDSITAEVATNYTVRFAFSEISFLEARRPSPIRTGILGAILVPAAALATRAVFCMLPHTARRLRPRRAARHHR